MPDPSLMDLDTERDAVVKELTRQCGDGRLTLDELEDRIAEAYVAEDRAALGHVLRDLPVRRVAEPVAAPAPTGARPASSARVDTRRNDHAHRAGLAPIFVIGGFVALFNGMLLLAIILWFVVPKLVLPKLCRA